jgi:SAM-dependent methyltransferase
MSQVTVDLEAESPYAEPDSAWYRFKRKLTYRTVLSAIRRIVGKKRAFSLLEVGTGSGYLVSFIESEFPDARVVGIEYDARLVALTREKVARARILQGNAEAIPLQGEKFDVVVSLQVIEHLYHPERMLASVFNLLAPGGRFILTTPNLGSVSARVMGSRWHGYRPDHVTLKDRSGWVELVERQGFKTVYSGSTFFTGIPMLNRLPLGILNWGLLFAIGALPWGQGESFIGVFERPKTEPR